MDDTYSMFEEKEAVGLMSLLEDARDISKSSLSDEDAIFELGEGWVAEETLAMAVLSCLRHPDDPLHALRMAVNITGDSDSVGSVTGNIIGAMLGSDVVRDVFKHVPLEGQDLIDEYAGKLVRRRSDR